MKAFISHNSLDGEWVAHIKQELAAFGIDAYMYEHDSQPGHPVVEKIQAEIQRSDAVIAFITKNSAGAPFVHQEIGYALRAGRLVIPLVERGLSKDALAMLGGLQYVPFDFDAPRKGIDDLGQYLKRLDDQRIRDQNVRIAVAAIVLILLLAAYTEGGA